MCDLRRFCVCVQVYRGGEAEETPVHVPTVRPGTSGLHRNEVRPAADQTDPGQDAQALPAGTYGPNPGKHTPSSPPYLMMSSCDNKV